MTRATTAAYLYCVVRAARRPPQTRMPSGVPGSTPPEARSIAPSLWVIASSVPLDVYAPAALEPRLRDLDWVSRAAVAHDAVVDHMARRRGAIVIPMQLFTMFSSIDRAIAELAGRRRDLARTMKKIAGAEEWGLRVFRRGPAADSGEARTSAASGTDFLRARQQARSRAAGARAAAAGATDLAFARLRRLARDARVRAPRPEPGTNPPILDAAFLVPSSSRARFTAEAKRQVRALDAAGADVSLSGPWPAYNFVGDPA